MYVIMRLIYIYIEDSALANTIVIDYEKVRTLASIGLTDEQIAVSIGVSRSTITRRKREDGAFEAAIRDGKQAGLTKVVSSLFNAATDASKPNMSAAIFYLKNRSGGTWRDKQEIDANLSGSMIIDHDIDAALQALKDAGVDPASL